MINKLKIRLLFLSIIYILVDLFLLFLDLLWLYDTRGIIYLVSILYLTYFISSVLLNKSKYISLELKYLYYFRICYSLICLITSLQHYSLIEYGLESHNIVNELINFEANFITLKTISYLLSTIYITSILLLLFNVNTRVQFLILFIIGSFVIPFSLETFLKNIINFGCMLISNNAWKEKKHSEFDSSAIFLIGLCLTIISTFAGLYKALDPVWLNSLGLYYTLNIPFFMPRPLWFLLDYKLIILSLNWVVIIAESLALPLFLFKNTRSIAILILFSLGLFLSIFMANIGLVGGPTILAACILILSIRNRSSKKDALSF